jgi:hypothetical protein
MFFGTQCFKKLRVIHCGEPPHHVFRPQVGRGPQLGPQDHVHCEEKLVRCILSNLVFDTGCDKLGAHAFAAARAVDRRVYDRFSEALLAKYVTARFHFHGILDVVQADGARPVFESVQGVVLLAKVRVARTGALAPVSVAKFLTKLALATAVLCDGDAPHCLYVAQ